MRSDTHTSVWNGTYKQCTLIMCVCVDHVCVTERWARTCRTHGASGRHR